MSAYRDSEMDELARYIETATALVRFAQRRDLSMVRRALHQLTNIVAGWCLSIEIADREVVRQAELAKEQQLELEE